MSTEKTWVVFVGRTHKLLACGSRKEDRSFLEGGFAWRCSRSDTADIVTKNCNFFTIPVATRRNIMCLQLGNESGQLQVMSDGLMATMYAFPVAPRMITMF